MATGTWSSRQLTPFLEQVYGQSVPRDGMPMGYTWDGRRSVLAGAVRHVLDAGSVQTKWNHFLECNPAQQGCACGRAGPVLRGVQYNTVNSRNMQCTYAAFYCKWTTTLKDSQ